MRAITSSRTFSGLRVHSVPKEGIMSTLRRLLATGIAGAMLGLVLAVAVPPAPTAASASLHDCVCNDGGSGNYSCSGDQTSCRSGGETCEVTCK